MSRHARSHPPTLLTLARRALEGEASPVRGARILVAVSGGRDSMALLHVMARLRAPLGFELVAHGIDHGLRRDAARELDQVASFAEGLAVPFARTCVDVAPGGNLQARAREARYAALEEAASLAEATLLATAHHADDRAETVLLRLLRGASASGLGVLPARAGPRIRPLIRAHRAAIDAHVARHQVPFVDDPSNTDLRHARTRVRHELLPLLHQLSPGIVEHLCGLADDLVATFSPAASQAGETENEGDGRPSSRQLAVEVEVEATSLPRPVRVALASLASSRDPHVRVALAGAREARYDRILGRVVVEKPPTGSVRSNTRAARPSRASRSNTR